MKGAQNRTRTDGTDPRQQKRKSAIASRRQLTADNVLTCNKGPLSYDFKDRYHQSQQL